MCSKSANGAAVWTARTSSDETTLAMLLPYPPWIGAATSLACCTPVASSGVPGGTVSMMPALLSIDSPCRTRSSTIDPSSAQASADPVHINPVDSTPTKT
ncbi:MAG: hypothetical protein WBV80_15810 [Mycobacterium sp.]